jgi:protein TonB
MVPPEGIEKAQPATLPADFSEWDSGDGPAEPPARPATARVAVAHEADRPANGGSYSPAPVNADVEKLFQPRRTESQYVAVEKHKAEGKVEFKGKVAYTALGSLAILLVLGGLGYSRLRSKAVTPTTTAMSLPAPVNTPQPAATNLPASAPVAAPAVTAPGPTPRTQPDMMNNQLAAPSRIPNDLKMLAGKEPPPSSGFAANGMEGLGGGEGNVFTGRSGPNVKIEAPRKAIISAGVAGGLLIQKTAPVYPQIAKEARVSGTVVLQAMISRAGMIENLRVVSGPTMLRQSAMDAVKTWRYRPYLLDGEPVEVETTVSVTFSLGG